MPNLIDSHLALVPTSCGGGSSNQHPRLFHYTTLQGFLGIISSKVIWATNIHYLNDSEEFAYGLAYLRTEAEARVETAPSGHQAILLRVASLVDFFKQGYVYTASFAEDDDLLSQWRGYGAGGGVCLGFVVSDLQKIAQRSGFRLIKCIYEQSQKAALAREFLDQSLATLDPVASMDDGTVEEFANQIVTRYQQLACAFKDPSFREECEWRIISKFVPVDHPSVKVRGTSTMLVPYFEVDLELGEDGQGRTSIGVDTLVVGPSLQKERILQAASIASRNLTVETARPSDIPYRSL
ncbi:DUF2971 domain-containing protein [Rhizobium cauense]|uniref:DUF2971 domain-containing protein n=1 Tax=Rhizobium cauense TaxID=1166683 RepID=UPI001C6E2560|nr:DUF2971 domain-containing protein [Rhizobium cauense]MBW9117019.1 DUF2971 domain-containing protein [Rhizobium cauense]